MRRVQGPGECAGGFLIQQERQGSILPERFGSVAIALALLLTPACGAAQTVSNQPEHSLLNLGTGCAMAVGGGVSAPLDCLSNVGRNNGLPQIATPALPFPLNSPPPSMAALQQSSPSAHQPQANQQKNRGKKRQYSPSATTGSPGHIFWVVPAYKVDYQHGFKPLTPREKFSEWAESTYDPLGLAIGAVEAGTLQYSSTDGFCGYGHGWVGYGKCYGSMQLDATDSSFIGDFALTVLLHQDPRYFRLGRGSFGTRTWYAITRVFVTHKDSGKMTFYSSGLTGTVVAAAVSNLYYPKSDVGLGPTVSRIGIDLGNTALYNGAAEFWPDIHRELRKVF